MWHVQSPVSPRLVEGMMNEVKHHWRHVHGPKCVCVRAFISACTMSSLVFMLRIFIIYCEWVNDNPYFDVHVLIPTSMYMCFVLFSALSQRVEGPLRSPVLLYPCIQLFIDYSSSFCCTCVRCMERRRSRGPNDDMEMNKTVKKRFNRNYHEA